MTWADFSPVHEQLRQYTLQIEDHVRQEERQRIARDLHDSLGNTLTALNIQLQTAAKLWKLDPAKAELFLTQAQRLGSTAIQEVRQSVGSLRTVAEDPPLEVMIESLVEDFGPIAPLIMQQALQSSPQTMAELIEILAAKIPDAQAAAGFQRRLHSWSQN